MAQNQSPHPPGATGGAVYSDRQILEAIAGGKIVCHPFDKTQVNGASVNITLGHWYYKTEYGSNASVYNPFSEKDVGEYFTGPFEAIEHRAWAQQAHSRLLDNIPPTHPVIVLEPQQRILAHSHEYIGIKAPGASSMHARSTWGRNGVAVCIDAGWGDPGYINRWTMEIYNLNQHRRVVLPVGEYVAQIIFYHTGEVANSYEKVGRYQSSDDLSTLISQWRPSDMLPKAYRDKKRRRAKDLDTT